jgi:hypothetical protein
MADAIARFLCHLQVCLTVLPDKAGRRDVR